MKRQVFGNDSWLQAAAFYLRYQVFVLEQGIPAELEFDELDKQQPDFFVMFDGQIPIATIRYQSDSKRADWIRPDRFCVAKPYRKQGIGQQLLVDYEAKAQKEGYLGSVLSAEASAQGFYEKLGYQPFGDPFYEDGILCITMEKHF
ncbi:GNAT family N-acetyltransferase [Enterococcus asini]|uniref:GNAT family N-acetyltransferase n=1 Tax=Enterococcus asini TaxID=57732 RepID=UPI00288D5D9E|nr:GNAT family N-acetyltransferase [Enterococcus asini]MDT2763139.1 GNAT family N-acetyltransferase [Enterococcus asini]